MTNLEKQVYWEPSSAELEGSFLFQFQKKIENKYHLKFKNYADFQKWSCKNHQDFWIEFLEESGIIYEGEKTPVISDSEFFHKRNFFPNLKINFAENILRNLSETPLVEIFEDREKKTWSKEEFLQAVFALKNYFQKVGLVAGDSVAALMPNCAEAILCMLAVTSLGAQWSSCSTEFGEKAVLDRFSQLNPKFLITVNETTYNAKKISLLEKNQKILTELKGAKEFLIERNQADSQFQKIIQADGGKVEAESFERFPFNHPVYVLFSSGTTGKPKCLVHGAGGTLIQHSKEMRLHSNLKKNEKLFYYTTTGWMMWNWMLSGLAEGAQIFTYEGSPLPKEGKNLWQIAHDEEVECLGTSARFIAACEARNLQIKKSEKLRTVFSTGSPLLPENYDYFYGIIDPEKKIQLASISGGTDIVSCFLLGNPVSPVCRGEIQGAGLGMEVAAFRGDGQAVINEKAELVCLREFPSMPLYFLNDPDNTRYESAYFQRFKNLWHHGDFISINERGGILVHGRSDATLNPGGVRIGTAEIYRQCHSVEVLQDSLVCAYRRDGDDEIVLFVQLKEAVERNDSILEEIKQAIRAGASPRHLPKHSFFVSAIPSTLSGKKVELSVQKILHGQEITNLEALANPESLEEYKQIAKKFFKG